MIAHQRYVEVFLLYPQTDYYIEAVDGYTNFYLNKLSGVDLTQQDNMTQEPTASLLSNCRYHRLHQVEYNS